VNSSYLIALANHLWQSTLFAVAVGCLTLLLRKNSARVRYSLWLAASAKFLVPFSLLTAVGAQIPWSPGPIHETQPFFISSVAHMAAQIAQFGGEDPTAVEQVAIAADSSNVLLIALGILWALGTLAVAARWFTRWRLVRRALRQSTESSLAFVIPVRFSSSQLEPGVVGILRPVLLLPEGMEERLTPAQMRAVLAHEACHVAWRDNLAAALHMLVEALFWFHPLTWWLGRRLVEERERACDEYVLAGGHAPESYAEGILNVCEHYLKSRLPCVSGVSGADLRKRIEGIMNIRLIERLSGVRKLVIAVAASVTIAAPVAVGVLTSPHAIAQARAPDTGEPAYRNVTIQLTPPNGKNSDAFAFTDTIFMHNVALRSLIAAAYGVPLPQVVGRDWSREPTYDIRSDDPQISPPIEKRRAMLRDVLTKDFGLIVTQEKKQMDGYVLLIGSGGSKLKLNTDVPPSKPLFWLSHFDVDIRGLPLSEFAKVFTNVFRAPVVDQTGLRGNYDYEASWESPPVGEPPDPAAVAQALEEQLGLHVEARPVTVDVINVVGLKSPEEVVTKRGDAG